MDSLHNSAILVPDTYSQVTLICVHQDSCTRRFTEALCIKQNTENNQNISQKLNKKENVHEAYSRILHNREHEWTPVTRMNLRNWVECAKHFAEEHIQSDLIYLMIKIS